MGRAGAFGEFDAGAVGVAVIVESVSLAVSLLILPREWVPLLHLYPVVRS